MGLDDHTSVLVDEKVYLWAGRWKDVPRLHNSEEKLQAAYVDVLHYRLAM